MMREWKRQEIILLFHAVCNNPVENFRFEGDKVPSRVIELAGLFQKPTSIVFEKIHHLLYLYSQGQYGKWSGGDRIDREVFEEFNEEQERLRFVTTKIKEDILNNTQNYEDIFESFDRAEAKEIERFQKDGWTTVLEKENISPSIYYRTVRQYERMPTVSAITKLRADFKCEIQECDYKPFIGRHKVPYIEVHHIERLADGGEDTVINTACLCPDHHREIHFGENKERLKRILLERREKVKDIQK